MDERDERMVKNEALFRQVNERLKEIGESFSLVAEHAEFVCECADASCTARISMSLEEYERIRAKPAHFFMVRGHQRPEIEDVVEEHEHYVVTKKPVGELHDAAVEADTRD
jgi:hypothetical protein